MYCPSCGREIDDNSRFCSTCGEKITDVLNDLGIRYKGGDQSAFQEIYDDTVSWVRSYVYNRVSSNNVEDCLQSVYIKLFENISKFDETKGPFRAWFNTLVANETIDFLRKYEKPQSKNVDSLYDEEDKVIDIVDPGMSPEDVMEKQEVAQIMSEILAEISEDQRQCIMLRYMEGLKNKEIADIMGISEGTVKSRISYGLKRVEAKVIALEKQGTKLYSMAPLPFFIWIICRGNVAGLTISGNLWSNIAASTFGMSANAVAGVAVTAGGANAMAGMGTAMNAGIAAETGAVAGAEAMTGAEALSGAGMSISSGISAEVGTVAGSEAMMGAGTSISAGISVETGAAGTGAVAEVSTGASAGAVAEVSTGSTAAAGGSATASAGATAGTGVSASGATTVTGGMTKAGAGVAAGATGLAAMGLKGLLIKIFLGITIAAAAVGGGFGIKHLVEKAKKIESESESSIGKPTTEEVATATDADVVVIGDATATDVVVTDATATDADKVVYPEWIDAYVEKLEIEIETITYNYFDLGLIDVNGDDVPEMYFKTFDSFGKMYTYSNGQVIDINGEYDSNKFYVNRETSRGAMLVARHHSEAPWTFIVFKIEDNMMIFEYEVCFSNDVLDGGDECSKSEYVDGVLDYENRKTMTFEEANSLVSEFIVAEEFYDPGYGFVTELRYSVKEGIEELEVENIYVSSSDLVDCEDIRICLQEYYLTSIGTYTDDYKLAYIDKVKDIVSIHGDKINGINLIDIDNDGIPELFIAGENGVSDVGVYTYNGSEVKMLGNYGDFDLDYMRGLATINKYKDNIRYFVELPNGKIRILVIRKSGYELICDCDMYCTPNDDSISFSIVENGNERQLTEEEKDAIFRDYNMEILGQYDITMNYGRLSEFKYTYTYDGISRMDEVIDYINNY